MLRVAASDHINKALWCCRASCNGPVSMLRASASDHINEALWLVGHHVMAPVSMLWASASDHINEALWRCGASCNGQYQCSGPPHQIILTRPYDVMEYHVMSPIPLTMSYNVAEHHVVEHHVMAQIPMLRAATSDHINKALWRCRASCNGPNTNALGAASDHINKAL
jgi:hypothetical protein